MFDDDCSAVLAGSGIDAKGSPCVVEFASAEFEGTEEDAFDSAKCLGNKIEFNVGCIANSESKTPRGQ